jgi:hypothetical protein
MAKKKAPPKAAVERVSVLNLKGSPEYREWLSTISKKSLIPVAAIIRDSVANWAEARGYPKPPEL